jgi:hypothetical protein
MKSTQTKVPPSAMPKKTRVAINPEYDLTNAVAIDTTPKQVTIAASQTEPKCFKARFEGISETMYYSCEP